jgi:hypothetical protein
MIQKPTARASSLTSRVCSARAPRRPSSKVAETSRSRERAALTPPPRTAFGAFLAGGGAPEFVKAAEAAMVAEEKKNETADLLQLLEAKAALQKERALSKSAQRRRRRHAKSGVWHCDAELEVHCAIQSWTVSFSRSNGSSGPRKRSW